jgi:hypothetical protein
MSCRGPAPKPSNETENVLTLTLLIEVSIVSPEKIPQPTGVGAYYYQDMAQSLADPSTSIDALIDLVTEVLGDRETAFRWMGTPVQALNYATPISLLNNDDGFARVTNVLEQLQHGVY